MHTRNDKKIFKTGLIGEFFASFWGVFNCSHPAVARLGANNTSIVTKLLHRQFDSLHLCILDFGQETDAFQLEPSQ